MLFTQDEPTDDRGKFSVMFELIQLHFIIFIFNAKEIILNCYIKFMYIEIV